MRDRFKVIGLRLNGGEEGEVKGDRLKERDRREKNGKGEAPWSLERKVLPTPFLHLFTYNLTPCTFIRMPYVKGSYQPYTLYIFTV